MNTSKTAFRRVVVMVALGLGFSVLMLSLFISPSAIAYTPSSFYTVPPTEEQEQIGKDENGSKLDYNECPGYDDGIDPSEYEDMTTEEMGTITDNVDKRVMELRAQGNYLDDDEQEELECLEAIRSIEEYAPIAMVRL